MRNAVKLAGLKTTRQSIKAMQSFKLYLRSRIQHLADSWDTSKLTGQNGGIGFFGINNV
jgi:hypothetical protein